MTFNTFVAGTKAKASEVNTNFDGRSIHQVYSSTALDVDASTGSPDTNSLELTSISSSDAPKYVLIKITGYYTTSDSSGTGQVELKMQSQNLNALTYADLFGYRTMQYSDIGSGIVRDRNTFTFEYLHELSSDEITYGVQIKVFLQATRSGSGTATFNLIQLTQQLVNV